MDNTEQVQTVESTRPKQRCEICNKDLVDLKSHNRFKHSDTPSNIECTVCHRFYNRYYLKNHKCKVSA